MILADEETISSDEEEAVAVTRNITPRADFVTIKQALDQEENVQLIAVSAGWGQMGIIGFDEPVILAKILSIEQGLREAGLIV